ncbi:MAG: nitrile hydratase accessory protein [Pseudomonadaceae bacterium]|jgi:nitrile hydratase accessory protein|nr:nitrile hydratase accessory protein [Pseudomonadaceae bacterium]
MTDVPQPSLEKVLSEHLQPPMANGEVLFEAPWHGRVFGMAVALHEAGVFNWDEFQLQLIDVIKLWDRTASDADEYQYYEHFQTALQQLMVDKGLLSREDLALRQTHLANLPHGHDH